jgi:hypothetical protein
VKNLKVKTCQFPSRAVINHQLMSKKTYELKPYFKGD